MGLFSNLFGKKEEATKIEPIPGDFSDEAIIAPVTGTFLPTKDISDPVFADETLGQTVAIVPSKGTVYAPVNGTIDMLADTAHAFSMTTADETQVLVHIGIDTVGLNGKGFKILAQKGSTVKAGTPVISADLDVIKKAGLDTAVMMILVDVPEGKTITFKEFTDVEAGTVINQ
ncbi:MAG: PTS glucose transporter subunit IIA [Solobacterium sp.]|nr:PTS glucose transporter subunit IIA [Solobacterium sp.]